MPYTIMSVSYVLGESGRAIAMNSNHSNGLITKQRWFLTNELDPQDNHYQVADSVWTMKSLNLLKRESDGFNFDLCWFCWRRTESCMEGTERLSSVYFGESYFLYKYW